MTPTLKVVTLHESTLRDVPAKLRQLADAIEAGEHGDVSCCGVAIMGSTMEAFGFGDGIMKDSVAPSVALLFQAAALRLVREVEQAGR
jgi:hypothetical protein